ncbi:MAG: hypothetical protein ACFFDX_09185 [Candidatus Odinarchaeota archaeon]
MENIELSNILKLIRENFKEDRFNLKLTSNIFFDILNQNEDKFNKFKQDIKFEWEQFRIKNQKRVITKTYSSFFYQKFHEYFKYFLQNFCGFNIESLDLVIKEKISEDTVFLEYNYYLSDEELEYFNELKRKINNHINGITSPFGYIYLIVSILGIILRKLLQEKFHIILDGAVIKNGEAKNTINFLIVIKNSHDEIFENYYYMFLYYFLKHFKGIPDEYFEKLLQGRERLYQIALEEYPFAKERLVDLLYYFYKKCNLLHNFSPLLDFLNFVCARVEDSVFSKIDVIKRDFLANFNYTEEKKNALIKIFDFIDKKSTLYSTFQANNLPSVKSQFNLFLLYMKYYFGSGSLEAFEVGDLLFLPKEFKSILNQRNKKLKNIINASTIKDIEIFLDHFAIISNFDNFELLFEKIFGKQINHLNYEFFKTFLRSLNLRILSLIDQENKLINENPENKPLSFTIIIDHVCRMLYTLIDKIFIKANPNQASKNFIDPRSRYVGKNIALRVLELFIFQDLNVSDDVWPDYIISMNRSYLIEDLKSYNVEVQSSKFNEKFYNFTDIARFVITYNFISHKDQIMFEEWLINELISPLNDFISEIKVSIKNPKDKNEIYSKLNKYFLNQISNQNKDVKENFKLMCQHLTPYWHKS